ncbi:hypothetical protein D3C84_880010 [compost metagenome]
MQPVETDYPFGITLPHALWSTRRTRGVIHRAIRHVRQGIALLVQQLEFDPMLLLFLPGNLFTRVEGVRTVQGVVHDGP